jgi:putative ABC transport system permease protein
MIDLDKWQEIAATLGKNKLRTFLTALGVFWGIFMLVTLLAVGDGLNRGVKQSMSTFAPNAIYCGGRRTSLPYQGLPPGRWVQFDQDDIPALEAIPGVEHLAPRAYMGGWHGGSNVTRGSKTGSFMVTGNYPAFRHILRFDLMFGRWIDPYDLSDKRKVAVIGDSVYEQLFGRGEDPIGQHIEVRGVYFEIIGVIKPFGSGNEVDRQSQTVFLPLSTAQQAFNMGNRINIFAMTFDQDHDPDQLEQAIREALARRHKFDPADSEAMWSFNMAKEARKVQTIFIGINLLSWLVGGFTLLAGVLGVSNIMLIAVKERTKELGVRKALGATPGAITRMVLAEALALTALAGYLGLFAAVMAVEFLGPMLDGKGMMVTPMVQFQSAVVATLILVVGGAIAGVIPARHAARIKPIEALRAE